MPKLIERTGTAVGEWREHGDRAWIRVPCGWPRDRFFQTVELTVARDVRGEPFIAVQPQRQMVKGDSKGLWTSTYARGDFHTRDEYLAFLTTVVEAGKRAGWL